MALKGEHYGSFLHRDRRTGTVYLVTASRKHAQHYLFQEVAAQAVTVLLTAALTVGAVSLACNIYDGITKHPNTPHVLGKSPMRSAKAFVAVRSVADKITLG